MKSRLLLFLFALLIATMAWADVEINETTFPDENFRNWVLSQVYGKDNNLSQNEISIIKTIDVSDRNIKSLKGIEYFTALTNLNCSYNRLTALDVSKCTKLKRLECHGNLLTTLDVSNNTALTVLSCFYNLISPDAMDALVESLPTVSDGGLYVFVDDDYELNVMTTNQVAAAKAKGWIPYYYDGSQWQEYEGVDVYIEITEEIFPDENFRGWLLSQNYGKDGMLTKEEIAGVTIVDVSGERIQTLQGIEFFTALTELNCSSNQLTTLDLSQNIALTYLSCSINHLTELDLSQNTALTYLSCSINHLTKLNVSQNTALTNLNCYDNQLTALDVSQNTALSNLSCGFNQLTALDVSGSTALTYLSCVYNQLTVLDVSQNTALTELRCYYNQLTALNLSQNTALTSMDCDNNQLTRLDVSGCTALTSMDCNNNQLTTLGVSGCTALKYLQCYNNQLTALDVSGCTVLTELWCYQNLIKGDAMDALVESLPTTINSRMYAIYDVDEQNVMTVLQVAAAKAKRWSPKAFVNNKWQEYEGMEAYIEISEENFPDENFRSWVLSQSYGADGMLSGTEIVKVTSIRVNNKEIQTLQGIEFFTVLKELYCYNNQLTSLDVSKNTVLKYLYCYNNQLTTLDVSQNIALTELRCYQNQINGDAMDALVTSLPTTSNGKIYVIYSVDEQNMMTETQVAAGKVKGWTPYEYAGSQWQEYEGMEAYIEISEETFPDENFRAWVLSQKYGKDGKLSRKEIVGVTSISVDNKEIQALQGMELFTALTYLNCGSNQLTSLDVSQNTELTYLNCGSNQLTALDVSYNTALRNLYCDNNQLTVLDVSQNIALTEINCYNNHLTELDVSQNTALTDLNCYNNQLAALDMSQNTKLTLMYCYWNQISGDAMNALVESLPAVSNGKLYAIVNDDDEQNVMTEAQVAAAKSKGWITYEWAGGQWQEYDGVDAYIEISEETFPDENFRAWVLSQKYGKDGKLSRLEIAGVTSISVDGKEIQTLQGIELFTALTYLNCGSNQLTALDLSQNTVMTTLYCNNNKLTALDLSQNAALTELICYQNQIKDIAMDALIESLPTTNNGQFYVIYNLDEQDVMTEAQVAAAKAKGWIPYYNDGSLWDEYEGYEHYIRISAENFPDENFRSWVLNQKYGTDGKLSRREIAEVTRIAVSSKRIQTLQGIEFFTALTYLNCGSNQLTVLDLSQNTALTTLYCNTNLLTALDLSQNTALTKLYCYKNHIKDEEMDSLVESLPTTSKGQINVIYDIEEQNEMTTAQVAAAKAKGWTPYYYNSGQWQAYDGADGIHDPHVETEDESVYNLAGQRIADGNGQLKMDNGQLKSGIYIVNGKKVLMRSAK